MQDFPRPRTGQARGDAAPEADATAQDATIAEGGTPSSPPSAPKKTGADAMRALFESSDVTIRRGDETRVLSRAQEALAELQKRSTPPPAPVSGAPASRSSFPPPDSRHPAGPRFDRGLWIVLAIGLFAIAGWMVAYAL